MGQALLWPSNPRTFMRIFSATLWFCCVSLNGVVFAAPDDVRAEARDIYAHVVALKTSEGFGQVPVMARYLREKLLAAGFPERDIHILPLGETASLVARYRGDGSGGRPILLAAHMDVVTANPEDWERDPFTLIEDSGYFFGRGTADIKADISVITTTFIRLKREEFVPTRDLILAFTGDEETGQATTRELIEKHRDLVDAEFALNSDGGGGVFDERTGEARLYFVQGAEKAYATFEITARNPGGHSSEPRVKNAIYDLADALKALQAHKFPVQWNEWTLGSLAASGATTEGELGEVLRAFATGPGEGPAAERLAVEHSYVGRTRTTCIPTMLRGGHAENALPQTVVATVNCRIFPGNTGEEIRTELQRVAGDGVEVTLSGRVLDSIASPMRQDVLEAVTRAVHASYPDARIVPDQAPYYTDGAFFRASGIPTYGVSGMFLKDSDSFAHGLNERMPVHAFYNGLTHWYVLIKELAGR
jgi:acetylornithine deacetylase/succinyl-diaminopimelate desuccinylase-like protein